ncbi:MAG: hypothetical protein JJU30_12845 [Alkalimonas sp.]|nr:hypothetical protein [Alkalimonas sp.]
MKQTLLRLGAKRSLKISETTMSRLNEHQVIDKSVLRLWSTESVLENDGNFLLVLGSPLPAVTKVPTSWQDAVEKLSKIEGVYAALYWDQQAKKLVVCTDILGLQPLYYKECDGEIAFSDKTTAFTGEHSLAGWGAFLALGYTLGKDTLTENVYRVEPATIQVIDANNLSRDQQTYWAFDDSLPEATTSELQQALNQSVDLALKTYPVKEHGILMSGGYDSRLIAYLLKSRGVQLNATIVSHYDENLDADARFAKSVVKHLQIPYTLKVPDQAFFSSKQYLEYLEASDAEIPSLYLFISQVSQFVSAEVIWEGLLPGKTLKASEVSFLQFKENNVKSFEHNIWRAAELVFGIEVAQGMWESFERRWYEETAKFSDNGKGTALFNLAHRARNRVGINPFKVYQQQTKILMPGMSKAYIQAAMSISHERKQGHKLYQEIFGTYFPSALKFPVAHGSAIDLMHCKKTSAYLFDTAIKVSERLKQYPSIMRFLLPKPLKGFAVSELINSDKLLGVAGAGIDNDFSHKLRNGEQVPEQALRLLFYWRVWQWLREKPLDTYFKQ